MNLSLSLLAMTIFIPLRSRQHFIPSHVISQCLLADICNHTWIPECGFYAKRIHTRMFLDECDMFEFNCDYNMLYLVTNYSQCFGPATCPSVPNLLTRVQGFYIYYGTDGRRMLYHPPSGRSQTKHMFPMKIPATFDSTPSTKYNDRRRYTPEKTGRYLPWTDPPCAPCLRKAPTAFNKRQSLSQYWPPLEPPTGMFFPWATTSTKKRNTKHTTKGTTKSTKKATTQIIRTGTIGTVILKNVTVWKKGKKFYKVFIKKYYKTSNTTKNDDSDFLE